MSCLYLHLREYRNNSWQIIYVLVSCQAVNFREAPVRFSYSLGGGTVRAVPVFGFSSGSSGGGGFSISVQFKRMARFRFRFQFLENGSDGSGSSFSSWKNASDSSGFRFQFGSRAILQKWGGPKLKGRHLKGRIFLQASNSHPPKREIFKKQRSGGVPA